MSDPAIKKRAARARRMALENLSRAGYSVIETHGGPFALIGVRSAEARFVRVVIGETTAPDLSACRKYPVPPSCTREIWALESRARTFSITTL